MSADAELPIRQNESVSDYSKPLLEQDVDPDPLIQFGRWWGDARASAIRLPEAAAIATATRDGTPSVRMVLVKGFDDRGFVFFTNYASRKGRELSENPRAALLFHWDELGRQVRVEGEVLRVSERETAEYVRSRPRASQLSALASPQSEPIAGRAQLERRVGELAERFEGAELPLPVDWGGFRLRPGSWEFWQQRDDRLHDRLRYERVGGSRWRLVRLAP